MRLRRLLLLTLALVVVVSFLLVMINWRQVSEARKVEEASAPPEIKPVTIEPGPFQIQAEWKLGLEQSAVTVSSGQTLSEVMERLGLDRQKAQEAIQAVGELIDLTKVRPGAEVVLFRHKDTGEPVRLEYSFRQEPRLIMLNTPAGWAASTREYEAICRNKEVSGVINTSLWVDAVEARKLHPELVLGFADLFACDVDFLTDTQKGDSFRVLYEDRYCQGENMPPGRIFVAEYVNNGKKYEMFWFQDASGTGDYYDAQGNSRKKMFLQSPLQYRRISSLFSNSRMHPILKYARPHLGVDYAAPSGTPVETVASGVVTFVGRKGGYGNVVIVQHKNKYVTQYNHLSKFARDLKKGKKVDQGDLIGYVGSTGLSTGPHLDFRMRKAGNFVDPLMVLKDQASEPINPRDKPKFLEMVKARRTEMERLAREADEESESKGLQAARQK